MQKLLSSFVCERDEDIEYFLHERAIEFEQLNKTRTYIVLDETQMQNEDISEWIILGYFSLALKVLTVPDNYSVRQRKNIDGLNGKIHGEIITDFPCYLLGQFARNDKVDKTQLTGNALLDMALSVLSGAITAVGGRILMIECQNNISLIKSYKNKGFNLVSSVTDKNIKMVQMIRVIV